MNLELAEIIQLPKILDERGNLSFLEEGNQVPFKIERTYWVYDVPGGEIRGGHSFRTNQELVIALSGSFDVILTDGLKKRVFSLNRSYYGLYIPSGLWRHMENFSTNSFALFIASTKFDEHDYIRDYNEYKEGVKYI